MRAAGNNLWETLKNVYTNELGQDIIETSIKGGLAASGQAALTDMSAQEIALATAIGMAGAMGARPIGKRIGRRIGRGFDSLKSPDAPNALDSVNKMFTRFKENKNPVVREGADILQRRFMANYAKRDGQMSGYYEGLLGEILRESADDVTQIGLAVALPSLFAREEVLPEDQL